MNEQAFGKKVKQAEIALDAPALEAPALEAPALEAPALEAPAQTTARRVGRYAKRNKISSAFHYTADVTFAADSVSPM